MPTTIRDVRQDDLDWILEVNNAATPDVSELDRAGLERLASMACYFRVAESSGQRAGFLLAMQPEADYPSENFLWFKAHYDSFVYIDRVVVAPDFRGLGIGKIFYADIQSHAEQRAPLLTCEVNLVPRNDVSLLFHGTSGFHEVGQQSTEEGEKRVSLLAKELPAYAFVRERYGSA